MRSTLVVALVVALCACDGIARPGTIDGSVDGATSDVSLADVTSDGTDIGDTRDAGDATDATGASDVISASDATDAASAGDVTDAADASDPADASDVTDAADVLLRNGCPVLTEPVDRPDAAAGDDTWTAFAQGFFRSWCVRCHATARVTAEERMGAPTGFDWDDEASVRRELARIRSAVGVENYMPLTPPNPSCDERRRLIRWIDIGAP